jgi:hypothetical protein
MSQQNEEALNLEDSVPTAPQTRHLVVANPEVDPVDRYIEHYHDSKGQLKVSFNNIIG